MNNPHNPDVVVGGVGGGGGGVMPPHGAPQPPVPNNIMAPNPVYIIFVVVVLPTMLRI